MLPRPETLEIAISDIALDIILGNGLSVESLMFVMLAREEKQMSELKNISSMPAKRSAKVHSLWTGARKGDAVIDLKHKLPYLGKKLQMVRSSS